VILDARLTFPIGDYSITVEITDRWFSPRISRITDRWTYSAPLFLTYL